MNILDIVFIGIIVATLLASGIAAFIAITGDPTDHQRCRRETKNEEKIRRHLAHCREIERRNQMQARSSRQDNFPNPDPIHVISARADSGCDSSGF